MGNVEVDVDIRGALNRIERTQGTVDEGAKRIVRQLTVLAEGPMKSEAPTGGGRDTHMRDTVTTTFEDDGLTGRVFPSKETAGGRRLADIVTGNPGPWSSKPPADPLLDWADAKTGDPGIGWYLQEQIFEGGIQSFPNPFISRSVDRWRGQVQAVAGDEFGAALSRAGVIR